MTEQQTAVTELTELLGSKHVRVDLYESIAFNLSESGGGARMVDCAQVWQPGETRGGNFKWVKHNGPLVSDTRQESVGLLLGLVGGDGPTVGEVAGYLELMNPAPGGDMPATNPNHHQIELVLNAIKAMR